MVQVPRRPVISAPTLIRSLARLSTFAPPEAAPSLSDRLSQWLGWTDAIALSSALKANPPAATPGARAPAQDPAGELARVRADLAAAIARDCGLAAAPGGRIRALSAAERQRAASFADFPAYRQRYATSQQRMDTAISAVRTRMRARLAARSPQGARLAGVDAVMERVMGARERALLASVPNLLEGHFVRLRDTEQAAMAAPRVSGAAPLPPAGAWLDTFHRDMQSILLAELDIRLEPVEGLIAALASVSNGENVSEPGQQ
ncbi:DUF3348 domain-containing protein [Pandoraea nosoerga]|uniref:DUF3348 domain-containing protein n=1 Tax=Pandoraea nosoerga TaxID=2508296 RepID=A0A5E4TA76_9BURK|nr:DUF3348 domain-containing protein [Pandoraea nosoerga]MBN4664270.1 DUF3348 domain-containing protein [Pandoraea nosoerga]MBN4675835.1 DUF3348 domain-containing protein [Pandoraea nosoerga]MBN4679358.1 DUF3348 domain-containing protein [Pandoraea nosoerga]MBN4743645.1 DUF3348 domain-containing protein [Pandoraea nosoerga]VVD82979.1 hypothetical protein PNO31109_01201 [Pandoraea nosoerga]